jgi:hypothetical protein
MVRIFVPPGLWATAAAVRASTRNPTHLVFEGADEVLEAFAVADEGSTHRVVVEEGAASSPRVVMVRVRGFDPTRRRLTVALLAVTEPPR